MRASFIGAELRLVSLRLPNRQCPHAHPRPCRPRQGSESVCQKRLRRHTSRHSFQDAAWARDAGQRRSISYAVFNMFADDKTDLQLLHDHVSGDDTAFPEIVRRTSGATWAVILKITRNEEDAADAFQETYFSAHRAAKKFRGDSAVSTWIHRIAVNAALACVKKRQKNLTTVLADIEDIDVQSSTAPRVDLVHPSDAHLDVSRSLALLSHEQQQTILLVDMYGYTQVDAAQILGCAEGTIKSRLSRGRRALAEDLKHLRPTIAAGKLESFQEGTKDE